MQQVRFDSRRNLTTLALNVIDAFVHGLDETVQNIWVLFIQVDHACFSFLKSFINVLALVLGRDGSVLLESSP